jgi:ornithine cyclodeaminase/alanine dehydrogenase
MTLGQDLLYLSREDVERVGLSMGEVIEAVEAAFRGKAAGRCEMPPKPGVHTRPDAFIHAMPAYVADLDAAGLKWVSGYPANQARGLPYISGLFILNDAETGIPLAVMDAAWMTAVRTGAATAVAARHLARPESASLAILGCGVQGRTNLQALRCVMPALESVRAYDIAPGAQQRYCEEMLAATGLTIEPAASAEEAVRGADLVVTAGPILRNPTPVIEPDWLAPGVFACALDYDSYFTPAAMKACDGFVTDDLAQLRHYQNVGYFRDIPPVTAETAKVVSGAKPGRRAADERLLAMHLGLAIEDVATAARLYRRAVERGIGRRLPL